MRARPPLPVILVVDDDPDLRGLYANYLQLAGYGVLEAANGLEALELARAHQPQLIITDVEMPRMDGVRLVETIRRDPTTHAIPVICLSGLEQAIYRASRAGSYALLKPVSPERVVSLAQSVLDMSQTGPDLTGFERSPVPSKGWSRLGSS